MMKMYKYEIEKAKDRAQERANRENKEFVVVISKRRFVQISQGGFSEKDEKDWILLHTAKPTNPPVYNHDLLGGDPNCEHNVVAAAGGGVKCTKCPGWFCY